MKQQLSTTNSCIPLRVFLAGDTDVGKTTLISVLNKGTLDNGYGSARKDLLQHPHEKESGHTSSIISYVLSYSKDGSPLSTASEIPPEKYVHIFDGCGLQKYLKTTVHGITSSFPDYLIIAVNAKTGITSTTKEHMGIAIALQIPIVVVLTKIDACKSEEYSKALDSVTMLIKTNAQKALIPLFNEGYQESMEGIAEAVFNNKGIPVFSVSSITGEGINIFHSLLFSLQPRINSKECSKEATEVWVRKAYNVNDVGIVLEGLLKMGKVRKGQVLKLGPIKGAFEQVCVKSIVICSGEVSTAQSGMEVALRISVLNCKELKVDELKKLKGLMLLSKPDKSRIAKSFDAEVVVLRKTYLKVGRLLGIHCGPICQTAEITDLAGESFLTQGDRGLIKLKYQEGEFYMKEGEHILLRVGLTTALGVVTKIYS